MPAKTSTKRTTKVLPITPANPKGSIFSIFGGSISKGYIYLGFCDCITEPTLVEFVGKLNIPITKSTRINYLFVTNPKVTMDSVCQDMSYYRIPQDDLLYPTSENWFKCTENEMNSSMKKINRQPDVFKFNKGEKKKKTKDDDQTTATIGDEQADSTLASSVTTSSVTTSSVPKTRKPKNTTTTGDKKPRKSKTTTVIEDEPPTLPAQIVSGQGASKPKAKPPPKYGRKLKSEPESEPEQAPENVDQMMQSIKGSTTFSIANGDTEIVSDDEEEEEEESEEEGSGDDSQSD